MLTSQSEEFKQNVLPHINPTPHFTPLPSNPTPSANITVEVIAEFQQLSISPKLLYMDGLNYGAHFFGRNTSHWCALDAVKKIKRFIKAATNSGWQLKLFLDAATKSNEALKKWHQRREKEVRCETRNMPQGMLTLLGDAFQENGVEVFYSVEADNDDTLAAYASRDNAAILSGDHDFFRYRKLTCPIYGAFHVKNNRLHLTVLQPNDKYVPKRDLILPPPRVMDKDPSLVDLSSHIYRRGAPSSLVKRMGNLHVACRSLRQALYSRRGVQEAVLEIFPIWEDGKVIWLKDKVLPDDKLDHLLDRPSEALETLFPKEMLVKPEGVSAMEWKNHLYSIHAVVYELCALGNREGVSFLQMIIPAVVKFNEENKRVGHRAAKIVEVPVYETTCMVCQISIKLYEKDVKFYESKGFSMPKRCRACKAEKNDSRRRYYYY